MDDNAIPCYITQPTKIDEIKLAEGTLFETSVTRYTQHYGDSMIFCALIEEIIQLKERIKKLETPCEKK